MPDQVGVAVVGAGAWGMNHVRVWAELAALRVVCDSDPARLAAVSERHPEIHTTGSLNDVLDRGDVRAVVVATPASTHGEVALQALEARKDVLVEKPMATSLADAEKVCDAAERSGAVLMVGHVLEYHPAVVTLRDMVAEGALGKTLYMAAHRLNFGRLRIEESALWSFAPHDIALVLRLLGSLPEEVSCQGESYLSRGVADVTLMNMRFAGGARAHVFVSWLHPVKEHRFAVVGDRQMAVFDDAAAWPEKLTLYPHRVEWLEGRVPVAHRAEGTPVAVEEKEPLLAECEHFLRCVATRATPFTDARSGLDVLRVLEAGERSLERNGVPVPLAGDGIYIHPTAIVDPGAEVGRGTRVWHYSHVMEEARIGTNCVLGQNVFVGKDVRIGDGVKIQNNVSVYEGVELEDFVFCGPSMVFTNVVNPRSEVERKSEFRRTLVKRGATLGANCTILCGTTIGSYAFVAAGAVVTREVPDYALVVGVPARQTGWMCACGTRLDVTGDRIHCRACGRTYRRADAAIETIEE